NIRAGNTLVGFATEQELLRAIKADRHGQYRTGYEEVLEAFTEECELVSKAYAHFQNSQLINDQGSNSFREAKEELKSRLKQLNDRLNEYLADAYGVSKYEDMGGNTGLFSSPSTIQQETEGYKSWLTSHQPIHWFAEFYQIISGSGGFDVIIGNPPYVLYKDIKKTYSIQGYTSIDSGDLYAYVMERSMNLTGPQSKLSFIIPMSCFSVDGFKSIQKIYFEESEFIYISNWSGDAHPSKMFEGVDKRLHIVISSKSKEAECNVFSTNYIKWYSEERSNIFDLRVNYTSVDMESDPIFPTSVTKVQSLVEKSIIKKLKRGDTVAQRSQKPSSSSVVYYTRKVSFFLQFLDFVPKVLDEKNIKREPSELKRIYFPKQHDKDLVLCSLSSATFYMFYIVNSDCRNLNKREVYQFPIPKIEGSQSLTNIAKELMEDYVKNSFERTVDYKNKGSITVQYFNFRPSKPIIDQIDTVLAEHYGFTEEELDFIINYDIKYRIGKALFGEDGNGEEEEE
ncbi:MAG: Eco57I restriction-modification methylase domain-containing protein, partial [Fulvivirga sp.]|uniref:Eco57I restriction-modification methylase domain-containing protein n=1 Tax=Fulvivirga sp. TaxID=1931237 RepID=UPI0032ECC3A6